MTPDYAPLNAARCSVDMPTGSVVYAYDPFGRRSSRTGIPPAAPSGPDDVVASFTAFVHDGAQVIAETDALNVVEATYVYGIGIDEVLMMDRGSVLYFYLQDGLGSVDPLRSTAFRCILYHGVRQCMRRNLWPSI